MCTFPKAGLGDEFDNLRSLLSRASPAPPLRPRNQSQSKGRGGISRSRAATRAEPQPGAGGAGGAPRAARRPLPRPAAPPAEPSTHTFSDDFQQLLFLLGQFAFLYVNHCSRQLEGDSVSLEVLRRNEVSRVGAQVAVGRLEARTRSCQPRKHSNSLLSPAARAAAGELGRAGRAVSAGPATVPPPAPHWPSREEELRAAAAEDSHWSSLGRQKQMEKIRGGELNSSHAFSTSTLPGSDI